MPVPRPDQISGASFFLTLFDRSGPLTAASARQGLQIAEGCALAAVIVDYHMPEMNGHELA